MFFRGLNEKPYQLFRELEGGGAGDLNGNGDPGQGNSMGNDPQNVNSAAPGADTTDISPGLGVVEGILDVIGANGPAAGVLGGAIAASIAAGGYATTSDSVDLSGAPGGSEGATLQEIVAALQQQPIGFTTGWVPANGDMWAFGQTAAGPVAYDWGMQGGVPGMTVIPLNQS